MNEKNRNENCWETLSVRIPESKALASVNRTASTRRAAIRRQASETVVPSGMVSAFDNLSFFTVLSTPTELHISNQHNQIPSIHYTYIIRA